MRILCLFISYVSISFIPVQNQIFAQRASPEKIKEKYIHSDEDYVPNKNE
jgi:hypothetical protein